MANDIIIEDPYTDKPEENTVSSQNKKLVSWVMARVTPWVDHRNSNYQDKWEEYYRMARGKWHAKDKDRKSERSRIVTPAMQQAVEIAVAEIEEASFGKGRWFDISDDISDQKKEDVEAVRNLLLEDMNRENVPAILAKIFLNGAIYGTGIGKIVVDEIQEKVLKSAGTGQPPTVELVTRFRTRMAVISPLDFAIDPAAESIDEALGCAHIIDVPTHSVLEKQKTGVYLEGSVSGNLPDGGLDQDELLSNDKESVNITEYHGLVPRALLPINIEEDEELVDLGGGDETSGMTDDDYEDLVESIVTIANNSVLLRAVENPFVMQDRCIVAYQHDTVVGKFWGRGIVEKGYNSQKALDAETRGRIDAMALTVHPMIAVDATRMPRGGDTSIRPGRTIATQGNPNEILMPFKFGSVDNNTFHQTGELERMLQMATGSMDSATPVGISPRNQTASGMSMIQGGAIKRSKRTLANISRHFTTPLIHKIAWRYMQFDYERYPSVDVKFTVHTTLGIMAREYEQQQLSSLLNTVPPDSPAYWMLLRSIYENSSISNREEMLKIIDSLLQKALNPEPPPPEPMVMVKMKELELKSMVFQQDTQEKAAANKLALAKLNLDSDKNESDGLLKYTAALLNVAKAESEELGSQLSVYQAQLNNLSEGMENGKQP